MAREWFVRVGSREVGPISSAQLKELASSGRITPDSELKVAGGKWSRAGRVDGLFPVPMGIALPPETRPPTPAVIDSTANEQKQCPLCGEWIALAAKKCRHCNEFLDRPAPAAAAPAPVHLVQQVIVNQQAAPRWNPVVAALLSLLVPGLGQLYKGQPFNGLAWFVVTLIGYVALIVPGLVLHVFCVLGAASGNPSR